MAQQDPEELKRRIGLNVSLKRKALGLTQETFSQSLGSSVQWVSRVERGEENLTIITMVKLSNTLNVTVEDLFQAAE